MECPRCRTANLTSVNYTAGVILDVCPACRGIWFDASELDRLLDVAVKDLSPGKHDEQRANALCPKCHLPLSPFYYPQTLVVVDMCRECQGVWLDSGEFEEIRAVRTALRKRNELEEYAPVSGIKGDLIRFINSAIANLKSSM